jgi:rare lipoprotein A
MPAFRNRLSFAPLTLCFLLFLGGCHKQRAVVTSPIGSAPSNVILPPEEKVGLASWYGDPYHGRRTSNGETYNKYGMTAAHRTLPFDTVVKVNNLENGRNVKVRINDRGPFKDNRVIDLSYAAAKEISMIGPGTAKVSLEVLQVVPNPFPLTIQVGSFKDRNHAEDAKKSLEKSYRPVLIKKFESTEGKYYRVLVGEYPTPRLARQAVQELRSLHFDGLIVRLDP